MKYRCTICNEIVVYRSLHYEIVHADKINEAFVRAPKEAKVIGGNSAE